MALVAAVVLVLEAVGIALLQWILSIAVDAQQMSMAGLPTGAMSTGTLVGGILFGLYLLFCAFVMARSGLRDRAPGGFTRIVLISCAVVHGLLGALSVGLVGWVAFVGMMVVLGLIVLTLVAYDGPRGEGADEAPGGATPNGPPPAVAGPA
ncbi:hypothetical protein FCH28_18370 [Streptomyces piniterrae]|uniref:Uncharacterized protein n=1 Tax=Streptomyces piniterrae TaxID=2571125 RepID=A0A4V5MMH1_9ACTN|nr:hypothetical protein FCH28_18370 [Streptomyces piniterrae]